MQDYSKFLTFFNLIFTVPQNDALLKQFSPQEIDKSRLSVGFFQITDNFLRRIGKLKKFFHKYVGLFGCKK